MRLLTSFKFFCLFLLTACHKEPAKQPQLPPPKVSVDVAQQISIPILLSGIGHVIPCQSAEIKAQVEGRLMEVTYQEGQYVNEGDPLVTIDPAPYYASLEQAKGQLEEAKASLTYASYKKESYSHLIKDSFVSKVDFQQYRANEEEAEGQVIQADAALKTAKINLDYCFLKSPFKGRCGKKLVDVGNLITNNGQTLVVVSQLSPIYIDFSLPEKSLPKILQYSSKNRLVVQIQVPGNDQQLQAELAVIDNKIDQSTGMIPLRAIYSNEEESLWPGQFARCNLILYNKPNAILIPDAAPTMGRFGYYVAVVNGKNKVEVRNVTLGERYNGLVEITSDNIKPGEKVVTEGQINVFDGITVEIIAKDKE